MQLDAHHHLVVPEGSFVVQAELGDHHAGALPQAVLPRSHVLLPSADKHSANQPPFLPDSNVSHLKFGGNVLGDVIEDAVAGLPVLQPLPDEDAGGGGVEFAAAQHAVAVAHVVLEASVVDLTAGVPAHTHTHFHFHR